MLHTFGQNCWWKWQTCEWLEPAMPAASCTWRWSAPQNCSLLCSWKCSKIRETDVVLHTPVTLLAVISSRCPALLTCLFFFFRGLLFLEMGLGFCLDFLLGLLGGSCIHMDENIPLMRVLVTIAICSSVLWCECFDSLTVKIRTDQSHSPAFAWSPAHTHHCLDIGERDWNGRKINWPSS